MKLRQMHTVCASVLGSRIYSFVYPCFVTPEDGSLKCTEGMYEEEVENSHHSS